MSKSKAKLPKKKARSKQAKKNRNIVIWLIPILGFLLYANTLNHQYCLDDYSVIKDNYVVKQGVKGIPTLFKTSYRYGYWMSKGTLYRPLSLVMFAVEWTLAPDNPFLSHLINVLLYAFGGWLLFQLLALLFDEKYKWLALVTSLLYIAHPIHTEVVANIKSRDELLSLVFGIWMLLMVLRFVSKNDIKYLIGSLLLFLLALFSKENSVTWFGIVPLVLFFYQKTDLKKVGWITGLYLIPLVIFLLIRNSILGSTGSLEQVSILDNFFAQSSGGAYFASAIMMIVKYLKVLLLPTILVSDMGFSQVTEASFGRGDVLLGVLLMLGSLILVIRYWKTKGPLVFGLLFFWVTFSIVSNLVVTIGSSYAERFLFIPSLGFVLVLASGLIWLSQKLNKPFELKINHPIFLIFIVILVGYSAKTVLRNPAWHDSYTLYDTDIKHSPNSAKLTYHYGLEIGKKGKATKNPQLRIKYYDDAIAQFDKALSIYPNYADAHGLRGLYYYHKKNFDEAMASYEKCIAINPTKSEVYSNMGVIFFTKGQVKEAETAYQKALKYNPRFVDAYRNLGAVYASTRRFDQAIEQFQKGLLYESNNATLLFYLGSAYRDKGEPSKGQPFLERAYRIDPSLRK